jgi:hypothetical protein
MNIFLKAYINKQVLYVHALIVFPIFCFLGDEKIKLKACSLKLLNNFETLPVTRFKDPKAAILTLKMLTGSRLGFRKIIPEAACDKLILAH